MYSRLICILTAVWLLAGCQTTGSSDPDSIRYKLPVGSKLVLNQPLTIPAGRAHLMLQHGAAGTVAGELDVACRFEVKNLGPRTIEPDTFLITSISSGRRWVNQPDSMRFYKVIRLQPERETDILPMVCEYTDWPLQGRPVTITEIREALGDVFTLVTPSSADTPAQ
ncbi:MAG: hypothetical protein PVI50_00235 [Gammaproteobacteria bacterium]|jgi:hypothetical protein